MTEHNDDEHDEDERLIPLRDYTVTDFDPERQCCQEMTDHLRQDDLPIVYYPHDRSWGIAYPGDGSYQLIAHCPWCGVKLPRSLADEWHKELERQGLAFHDELPDDLKGEAWWIKRGL